MSAECTKKGQVAMEVMVYLGFFMLVFVFVLLFMLSSFNTDVNRRQFILEQETAGQIADYTQFMVRAGPGYIANFSIPRQISGHAYNATFVSSGWLYVDVAGNSLSFAYPTAVSNIYAGQGLQDNFYTDVSGVPRHSVKIDSSKGWISFNYAQTASGERILVR